MNYPETFKAIHKEVIGSPSGDKYGFLLDKVADYPEILWAVRRDTTGHDMCHLYDKRQLDEYFLTIWKYLG